jgi:eukaryotic-like serine/threonine-protein kinase
MPLTAGSRLGPYEVLSPLGAGRMGEVYRARDPRLGREVAVKIIASDVDASPERLRRFESEARAAGALNHPNVLSVFDVGVDAGSPYVVFELLEGETLRERLERGPLPVRKVVEYAVQICQGLAAAHDKGIVHRDLKPENLFLTKEGRVKILDFGLAKLTHDVDLSPSAEDRETRTATQPGLLLGTVAYMSPEQARGEAADARSDLFALGATLHEMLAGRPAFRRGTAAETLSAILSHDPEPIVSQTSGAVPPALEQIIRRCLEKEVEERFHSARDLGFALGALSASATDGAAAMPSVGRTRKVWLPVLLGGLVVVVAAVVVNHVFRGGSRMRPAQMTVVPFTSFPGVEIAPTFSPDGSQIAFAWSPEGTNGRFDLYVKVIGSEKPLLLTTHPADWIVPAWSPDGRLIAFSREAKDGNGIYVVPALGGPERKLSDTLSLRFWVGPVLSWSPDGKLLAFYDADAPDKLGGVSLLDVDTLEKRRLSNPPKDCEWVGAPVFSPDGRSLAVLCQLSLSVYELFAVPMSGGNASKIALVSGSFAGLTWTADGRSLVFASDDSLWRVSVAGGQPEKLPFGHDAHSPVASRIGHRLAYAQLTSNANIWRVQLAGPTRTAGPPMRLISSSRYQGNPAFSPDGRRVAFESTRSGAREIWIATADGFDPVKLTSFGGPMTGTPRWSPDGREIAFDSRASGQSDLYIVRVDGGPPRRVATGIPDSSVPAWSSDGRWLYFSTTNRPDGKDQVWKIRPEGGPAAQMTHRGGMCPRASVDGKRVYYLTGANGDYEIWSASVDGGDERAVSVMARLRVAYEDDWAPCASGIYLIDGKPPGPGIKFFNFATGQIERVVDTPKSLAVGGLAISPDGRSLLYGQHDEVAGDIMLVENFH